MDAKIWIEIFGYVGSALIIGSYPLAILSFSLVIINIYNLFKLLKPKNNYDLVVGKADDAFVNYFLSRYKEDIYSHFPGFTAAKKGDTAYIAAATVRLPALRSAASKTA